jgi:hypothetical protein
VGRNPKEVTSAAILPGKGIEQILTVRTTVATDAPEINNLRP